MQMFQLECFVKIAECQSFTEASYQLMLSQSSLSKHISKLEDDFQVKLFDRSKRQLLLTPAGIEFLAYAKRTLYEYQSIKQTMSAYASGGTIKIGSVDHMGKVGLTTPIALFMKRFPEGALRIDIEKGFAVQVVEWLLEGRTDIAFTAYIHDPVRDLSNLDHLNLDGYEYHTLVRDEYYAILPVDHPLADQPLLSWEDLRDEELLILDKSNSLNQMIRDSFLSRGITPHIAFECNQTDALLGMVENGFGISFLSGKIASTSYHVKKVPMQNPLSRDTWMIFPKEKRRTRELVYDFSKFISDYYTEKTL